MDITLSILAFVFTITGIVGCIVPALPGVVLSYAGLVCACLTSYSTIGGAALWTWLAITVAVSVIDYFLPAWMTRRFGGSRAGAIGATVGVFAGFFLFPPLGIVLGPFFGAVLGELLHDKSDPGKALLVGIGSFLSFIVGTGIKLVAAVGMLLHVAADTYPVLREWAAGLFLSTRIRPPPGPETAGPLHTISIHAKGRIRCGPPAVFRPGNARGRDLSDRGLAQGKRNLRREINSGSVRPCRVPPRERRYSRPASSSGA